MVFLWISIPLIIISVMAAGYLQNRRKKAEEANNSLSPEYEVTGDPFIEPGQTPAAGEKAYEGLLWLKGKYEEDIEQADTKFYELREEFKKLEKKYIDLRVHSISLEQQLHSAKEGLQGDRKGRVDLQSPVVLRREIDLQSREDNESEIDAQRDLLFLNDRLAAETQKVKELESRLASSSQLLMKMYKELAGSLEANNTFFKTKAHENRVKGLVKEFDAVASVAASGTEERKISSWVESPAVEEDGQFEQLG